MTLSDGRRVTLVSRPMTSAAGVDGVGDRGHVPRPLTEAAPHPPRARLTIPPPLPGRGARPPSGTSAPEAPAAPAHRAARGHITDGLAGLVLVGEPEVGKYALAARRRMELLSEASARIGTTLDVRRTAQELAETAVPGLADFVTIDLPDAVLRGEESPRPPRATCAAR